MTESRDDPGFNLPPDRFFDTLRVEPNVMEIFLLGLSLLTAFTLLVAGPRQFSVDLLLGPAWTVIWGVMLTVGAIAVLTGIFWRGHAVVGVALQQLGYAAFAVTALARAVAQIGVDRAAETPAVFGFAVAAAIRVVQLELRVRRVTSSGANHSRGRFARLRRRGDRR